MENELKAEFDIIVIGTGFVESLIAAAAARIGKKVLHLDRNGFYGGQWASFSLTSLEEWVEGLNEKRVISEASNDLLKEGETLCALTLPNSLYYGAKRYWSAPENVETAELSSALAGEAESEPGVESAKEGKTTIKVQKLWSKSELKKSNRKFNIDLAPKILFSRGALVELLISSNVARYVEFKCITRVLTWVDEEDEKSGVDGKLVNVPCSRSDVFTTDVISLVEKRLLMKFLEFCYSHEQNREEWAEYAERPFKEFLESRNLTPKLIHFITSAIGMVEDEADCTEGLKKTSLFLNSLGRYGTMPFLFTLYGSGEMPQAFCRLCAVFEGVYILRRDVDSFMVDGEGLCSSVVSEGQRFKGDSIVMDVGYAPETFKDKAVKKQSVSRGVFVTSKSIMVDEKEHLTILRMPTVDNNHRAVTVVELGSGCAVCPKDSYLVHLVCGGEDAEADLKLTAQRLFNLDNEDDSSKPSVLFSLYFNQVNYDLGKTNYENFPSNIHLCGGPDAALDYDEAIQQAKDIFIKIFPEEEFLPRAPDHNDIVFDHPAEEAPEGEKKEESVENVADKVNEMNLEAGSS